MTVTGRGLAPPAPVHLAGARQVDGTLSLSWVRRSRAGWAWTDGADAPLAEEAERYRLTLARADGATRTVERGTPAFDYTPAMQAQDGGAGAFHIEVRQIGAVASRPAVLTIAD